MNIYERMHAVMKAVSYVQKEDKKVNNQYTFVSHDAVTAKIRPALIENGVIAVPEVVRWKQDGNRTECDLHMTFVNIEKPEERVTVAMFGFGIDPSDKGPGKAISYAVKYALLKAFSLETGDDPERDNGLDHKAEKTSNDSPNKSVEREILSEGMLPEVREGVRIEAKTIEGDFYTLSGKAALTRWLAFKKDAAEAEVDLCWSLLDSKVRSGIKKVGEAHATA